VTFIRLATPADARVLAGMRYDFRAAMNPAAEPRQQFLERTTAWMAERLVPGSVWRCWVAERDGSITGHLWLQFIEKIPNPAPELEQHAYITNVYVAVEERGAGTGRALMEAALNACRDARVDSVILWPTEKSRTLYARHGFKLPTDIMEAILDAGRDVH